MNFDFSDDQKLLKEQVRKFLADKCPTKVVRRVLDGNETHAEDVWKGLVDLGVPALGIPEEYGGMGLSPLEVCVVAEEIGRAAAPVPFDTSVNVSSACLRAGSIVSMRFFATPAWRRSTRTSPPRLWMRAVSDSQCFFRERPADVVERLEGGEHRSDGGADDA